MVIFSLAIAGVLKLFIDSDLWPTSEFGKVIAILCFSFMYAVGGSKIWGMIKDKDDN